MKRVLFFSLSLVLILFTFCGCGKKTITEVDFDSLSFELLESGAFSDLLCPLDKEVASSLYGIDKNEFEDFALFCSTGATAEEIALFKGVDESSASQIKEAIEARIQNQISSYENYVPEEVPKLEEAIVMQHGVFVIYVTSNEPATVEEILNTYM